VAFPVMLLKVVVQDLEDSTLVALENHLKMRQLHL
jgi:hypothetical protein